ncbi:hypothetical protein CIHG_03914 [Coccidioides immitis H538.4]|uniref:RRM domain-containing protein n=1 Tax=Coccidioides immitis H538.4 TaxID=396776 RepID=A0A0J8RNI0_COCIT|nr:hypothetical protein CIHG_03914 [Coccidioides immitis H538.4]
MDRSLDEIIAERPRYSNRGRTRQSAGRRGNFSRDEARVHKVFLLFFLSLHPDSFRNDRADVELDWVHDKFEDDRDSGFLISQPTVIATFLTCQIQRALLPFEGPVPVVMAVFRRLLSSMPFSAIYGLFTGIGPILSLSLVYDRAGRSEGVAFVTYKRLVDAQTAIREFDGANAKGQPIRKSQEAAYLIERKGPAEILVA